MGGVGDVKDTSRAAVASEAGVVGDVIVVRDSIDTQDLSMSHASTPFPKGVAGSVPIAGLGAGKKAAPAPNCEKVSGRMPRSGELSPQSPGCGTIVPTEKNRASCARGGGGSACEMQTPGTWKNAQLLILHVSR